MATLRQETLRLKRKFKFVNKHRYFYNQKRDLKALGDVIHTWSIVESSSKGIFIFEFDFRRKQSLSVKQWTELWTTPKKLRNRKKKYLSLYEIMTDVVLPNISEKYNDDWKFIDLIGWTISGIHARRNKKLAKRPKKEKRKNA